MKTKKNMTPVGIFVAFAVLGLLFTTCNNDTADNSPTVTKVKINITTSSVVEKGGSLVFSATVSGTNEPGQGVTWDIVESYKHKETVISPSASAGVLNVSAHETCKWLTVRATSTVNKSKSGTLVIRVYEPGQLPTVSTVTVSPSSTSVAKGGTRTFTASVTGTNSPPQTVTWSIVQTSIKSGTAIDDNGKLTVSSSETLSSLTVRATSTVDNATSGTATVTVTSPVPPPAAGNGSFNFPIGPVDVYLDESYRDSESEVWIPQYTKVTDGSYDGSYIHVRDWDDNTDGPGLTPLGTYIDNPVTVQIQNNRLTINLGTPKAQHLENVADFELITMLNEIDPNHTITISDADAKMLIFAEGFQIHNQDGAILYYEGDDKDTTFCYVDRNVTISGSATRTGEYTYLYTFALNLRTGWNYVKLTENYDNLLVQTIRPGNDAKWVVSEAREADPSQQRLARPTNLQINDSTLTWDAVDNADWYLVEIDGTNNWTKGNSYSLSRLTTAGTYTIRVKATSDWPEFSDSPWSGSVQHTVLAAATPEIIQQPNGASYLTGDTIAALTVNATASDGGTISYQWYSSTTTFDSSLVAGWTSVGNANGGNTRTFTPPATAGIVFYYALVTNTKTYTMPFIATASSRAVMINVSEPAAANFRVQPKSAYYWADIAEYDDSKEHGKIISVTPLPAAQQPEGKIDALSFELDKTHSAAAGWKYQWYEANSWYGGYGFDADNIIIGEPGFSPDSSGMESGYFMDELGEKSNVTLFNGGDDYLRYPYPGRPISGATGPSYTPVPDKRPFLSGLSYESHYYWVVITDPSGRKAESARATIITETDKTNHHFIIDVNNLKDTSGNRVSPKNPVPFTYGYEPYAIDLRGALPPGFDILDYSYATAQAKFFLVDGTPWIQNWTQGNLSFVDLDNYPYQDGAQNKIVLFYNLTCNNGVYGLATDGREPEGANLDIPFTHVVIMPSGDHTKGVNHDGYPPLDANGRADSSIVGFDLQNWFCGFIELTELRFDGPSRK